MPSTGWNQDCIAWQNLAHAAVDFHHAPALTEVVNFLAEEVVMALCCRSGRKVCFGKTLVLHRRIGKIQEAANG